MTRKPIVALIYDFDGTLSPGNMQEFGFIQAIGKTPEEFWKMSDGIAAGQDASNILAYMKLMVDEAKKNDIKLKRSEFKKFGKDIKLFEGVTSWFDLVNEYGKSRGVRIEHYINSSGLKEIIEGCPIANSSSTFSQAHLSTTPRARQNGRESLWTTLPRRSSSSKSTREFSARGTLTRSMKVSRKTRNASLSRR